MVKLFETAIPAFSDVLLSTACLKLSDKPLKGDFAATSNTEI